MASFNPMSQLTKHGWTEGNGLGRNEHGMAEAIKVNLKFDTRGVGHDAAEEFTYHWWDHAFNKASESIKVDVDGEDVKVIKSKDYQISARKSHVTPSANKNLLYGRFVKAGTLTGNDLVEEDKPETESDSDSDSDSDNDKRHTEKMTDEELFKICGGLTAHKGARHGLKASGKLARIMEQERLETPTDTPASSPKRSDGSDSDTTSKKSKKKKKRKAEEVAEIEECESTPKKKKSKKNKKEKKERESVESSEETSTPDCGKKLDTEVPETKKKKKKSKKNKQDSDSDNVESSSKKKKSSELNEVEDVDNDKKKSKKKKKNKDKS